MNSSRKYSEKVMDLKLLLDFHNLDVSGESFIRAAAYNILIFFFVRKNITFASVTDFTMIVDYYYFFFFFFKKKIVSHTIV